MKAFSLAIGIFGTAALIFYLFLVWCWQPTEFEYGYVFRLILSGMVVATVIAVEIVFFRWFLNR